MYLHNVLLLKNSIINKSSLVNIGSSSHILLISFTLYLSLNSVERAITNPSISLLETPNGTFTL